jgi:hypothetical protein
MGLCFRGNARCLDGKVFYIQVEWRRALVGMLPGSAGMQGSIPGKAFFIQVGGWSAYARRLFGFRRGMESIGGNGFGIWEEKLETAEGEKLRDLWG